MKTSQPAPRGGQRSSTEEQPCRDSVFCSGSPEQGGSNLFQLYVISFVTLHPEAQAEEVGVKYCLLLMPNIFLFHLLKYENSLSYMNKYRIFWGMD